MGMGKIYPHLLQFLFSILHKCVWKWLPYLITCRLIFKQVKPEKNSSYLQNQTRMWMKAYMHNLVSTDLGFVVQKGSKVAYLTRITGLLHLMMMIPLNFSSWSSHPACNLIYQTFYVFNYFFPKPLCCWIWAQPLCYLCKGSACCHCGEELWASIYRSGHIRRDNWKHLHHKNKL